VPKNSRPDIQVLEARVDRLKAQLLEYKEIRTYGITKKRLSNVALELEECISIIGDITEQGKLVASSAQIISEAQDQTLAEDLVVEEFEDSGDLADIFTPNARPQEEKSIASNEYEPKFIIRNYAQRIQACADTAIGIVQVNQVTGLIAKWYQTRFSSNANYPSFHYKANRIHEWIDLLIIASGDALSQGTFPSFKAELDSWLEDLSTGKGENWVLPQNILQMQRDIPNRCSKEAVLIEKLLKPQLYDESFYPREISSIEKIVTTNTEWSSEELTVEAILSNCSTKFIQTSSFDISKYREET